MSNNFYFCVGCRQVHFDRDYCKRDGDLMIYDHEEFFKSVDEMKKKLNNKRKKNES